MRMKSQIFTLDLNGETLTAEFGDLALRAHGSVMLKMGETIVLATAVIGESDRQGIDFFPLTVEYEERFYATGKILGSRFVRREGRPSDEAVLSGRIVDRSIRPLFDERLRKEVQVVITVLSIGDYDPDFMSVIASSLALGSSHIPWDGPVSGLKVSIDGGKISLHPKISVLNDSSLMVCGIEDELNMIEMKGNEISEALVQKALEDASKEINKIQSWQRDVIQKVMDEKGIKKTTVSTKNLEASEIASFNDKFLPKINSVLFKKIQKTEQDLNAIQKEWLSEVKKENTDIARYHFDKTVRDILHNEAIDSGKRVDGRSTEDIRQIKVKAGDISSVIHGSGTFYRGDTHILSVLTLGSLNDAQLINDIEFTGEKRYIHHYNFPPFSTGETGKVGHANRRMIGHGALAEKALLPVLPDKKDFPYTMRIVSEAFSSNGSTSMASVCGSTIALMDGGVPIKSPVAGISIGIMMRETKGMIKKAFGQIGIAGAKSKYEYKLLTDIQGPEDHHGDMDFKVAGTMNGITAIQMDIKVRGIPVNILGEALQKAKTARLKIIDEIKREISMPRESLAKNAPKIKTIYVNKDLIGLLIGPGGKNINGITKKAGVDEIYVGEEEGGSALVYIIGRDQSKTKIAEDMIYESIKPLDKMDMK